ncbi:D-alanyl-D-alanine carboxypeptidase [Streptomyces hirsutus]
MLPKGLSARSWIVADAESGEVLAAHNAHWRLAPASTLKMLFTTPCCRSGPAGRNTRSSPPTWPASAPVPAWSGSRRTTYTVHDLWLGVFLRSGNDAVRVLAAMNGGVESTVKEMNEHAEEFQAFDTVVVSPDGYDAEGQVWSTYDLTLIARSGLQKKDFREYASTVRADLPGETKKNKKGKKVRESFEIQNTNRLLSGDYDVPIYQGIAGVKNGNHQRGRHLHRGRRAGRKGPARHRDEPGEEGERRGLQGDREAARLRDQGSRQGRSGG